MSVEGVEGRSRGVWESHPGYLDVVPAFTCEVVLLDAHPSEHVTPRVVDYLLVGRVCLWFVQYRLGLYCRSASRPVRLALHAYQDLYSAHTSVKIALQLVLPESHNTDAH